MARLGCNCGATMSNVDSPSKNLLRIFTAAEVEASIKANKDITLWDFSTMNRPYEYWYCTVCRRVHKVDNSIGKCILRYKPVGISSDPTGLIGSPGDWTELYVITDTELDSITEKEFTIRLIDYLPKIPRRIMISPDHSCAAVYDTINGNEIERYVSETVAEE